METTIKGVGYEYQMPARNANGLEHLGMCHWNTTPMTLVVQISQADS